MFNIEEQLKMLPDKPGVYIMHDVDDKIIYVGKAVNLKNRVRSYFRKTDKTERIKRMVSLIDHFEYIVVDNEAEALILECNLIKKNRPKFNVLLKDDKTYPYIKVDVKSDYPNVVITRKIINDGSKYFGPYANPGAAKEMVDFIKQKYKIRQCRNFRSETRACLNYHINRCLGPCMGYISKEDYNKYKIKPRINDLFMTRIGTIGKCAVYDKKIDLAYYVSLALIRPNNDVINTKYLKYVIESSIGQSELRKRTLVHAVPIKVNKDEIGKIILPVPSLKIQEEIIKILDKFDKLTNDILEGLPAEIKARQKQYEYYRNKLLSFPKYKLSA